MRWSAQLLDLWLEWVTQEQYELQGSGTVILRNWEMVLDLRTMPLTMRHAGFTDAKLNHLYRTYPFDALPTDGCLKSIGTDCVVWRRVDACRGLIADLIYLQALGLKKVTCRFEEVRLHKVRVSVILPLLKIDAIPNASLRKVWPRELRYRMDRMFDNHDSTRRMNDWAHLIHTKEEMRLTIERLAI